MAPEESLSRHFSEVFALPQPAVEWLLSLWNIVQVFDDVTDGDPVDPQALRRAIYDSLAGFYQNPFFAANAGALVPIMAVNVLKWQGANTAERDGKVGPVSFTWRAGYYDIVLMVVSLCHGAQAAEEHAHLVMALYGESFDDYLTEFHHA